MCWKNFILYYHTPTLQRHENIWAYHFPQQQEVTLRCRKDNAWISHAEILFGAGLVFNATACSITTIEFRTLLEPCRKTQTTLDTPHLYLPDKIPVIVDQEVQALQEIIPAEIMQLDDIKSHVMAPQQVLDVDSLLHIRQTSLS